MFKTIITAATLSLAAAAAHAVPAFDTPEQALAIDAVTEVEQVAYYCEWATVYDYWGNWMTVWQCY